MTLKSYKAILKIGVIAGFLSFFIISNSLYFPYITGKQIYFNILVEVLFVFWAAMIAKFPETRPKKNYITIGLAVFLLALLLSSFFGVDFNLSFWGDAERMLGWFSLIHYFVFYLFIISVFNDEKDWSWALHAGVASAAVLALYAFLTNKGQRFSGNINLTSNISTLGNATYVAGVMLFAFWFIVYLFLKTKDRFLRIVYILLEVLILAGFFYADVSGSQAGWGLSILFFILFFAFLSRNKALKKWLWVAFSTGLIAVILLFVFRDAAIFDNTKLGKILRDYSYKNINFETRLYAWRAGLKGVAERPAFGSGYGNYAYFFDKYFDSGYYNWSTTEEYFDRAHNNLIDLAATGGLISLLAYLSIFIAVAAYLIKAYRQGRAPLLEIATIGAIIIAYFIHNLAVFDAIANYILLMITLGWVYCLTIEPAKQNPSKPVAEAEGWTWLVAGAFSLFLIFNYNVAFIKLFRSAINSSRSWQTGDVAEIYNSWQKTLSYNTPLDRDIRNLLIGQLSPYFDLLDESKAPERDRLLDLAVAGAMDNLKLAPDDLIFNISAAYILSIRGEIKENPDDLSRAYGFAKRAVEVGGQHLPPMIFLIRYEASLGYVDQAIKRADMAIGWFDKYTQLYCLRGDIKLYYNQDYSEKTINDIDYCLDNNGGRYLHASYLDKLSDHYRRQGDEKRLETINELMTLMK